MGNTENTKITTNDKWAITTNRFVAFIDIMGFKNMVATLPNEVIYSMMKKVKYKRDLAANIKWSTNGLKLVRTTTYSDSIMVYSKDESLESFEYLIKTVAMLTHELFIEGIPHKGSVAHGLMTLDIENSIFFGQPLIDAYLLQEELNFYGIILHATCESQIENKFKKLIPFVNNYMCPFKTGNSNHLTVCPIFTYGEKYKAHREKMFEAIKKFRHLTSGGLRKYIDNTEVYLKKINSLYVETAPN